MRREERNSRRLLAAVALALAGLVLSGCITTASTEPWSPERADAEAGVAQLLADWAGTGRVTAPVVVVRASQWGGAYGAVENVAYVFYDDGADRPVSSYRAVAAHELGHAWDRNHGVPSASSRYKEIRGLPPGSWPFEDYADVFAMILAGLPVGAYATRYPPAAQIRALQAEGLVPR